MRETISSNSRGELYRDDGAMYWRNADTGKVSYLSHSPALRNREVPFGPPGDRYRFIPECPCVACGAGRETVLEMAARD